MTVLGFVYFPGNSFLAFRVLRKKKKPCVNAVHAFLHITAFVITLIGLIAIVTFDADMKRPNMYSAHSWIGIACMVLFFVHYAIGFYVYVYPTVSGRIRSKILPYHVSGGLALFILSISNF